ncbi:Zn(II)2Cys6 transcription factor (Eurofung) [Fusarium napiforme]|uniref:Zn(II)2Cys6 transcription factor (Eurofung) n=1 Tax=Fusarium napiforme TaxID=42672 RepID=A0A8H5N430_9HYPO|nr:Zn(II)2Cys6 transcription factor (Eurofung) [Fusarium napiforme]
MAMLSTVVLLGCAVANVASQCFIKAPDFLNSVTGMTRDSPYIQVNLPGGSGVSSCDRILELGCDIVRQYVDAKLESHQEIEGESDGHQLRPLQVEEDKVQQTCEDADGPCDYCRSIDEVCSVDMEKRRQKPFYFVSEEEYRLLRELCSKCFPDEELTIPNLRRLIDDNQKPVLKTQTDIATPTMSLIEVSADAPLVDCGDEPIDQGEVLLHDVEETHVEEEEIFLPEIVNLHQDLGCLLADTHGEYRYMGAESGVSFNSAVRSWMLRMGAGTRSKEKDKDKIPGMLKVSPPSVKSPLTDAASSPGNPCQFPSQDLLSACAARFFEQVHCLYWIYSAESFYTRLETTYSGDTGQLTASWLCSLHGIVALCASCEPSPNGLVNGQRAHDSLEMAKSLVTRVCDEADLDSIRALIVLSLAFQSNGFTNSAYLHIGLAVRIAFSLGLHLDKYSTKSGVVSQAHARRLWWTLYLVDQDLSLALGKPSMNSPPNETSWKPPLPSEFVVSPGSHTPNGYLQQCIRLAQITQSIRQTLYDGPLHGGQKLSRTHFNDSINALQDWLDHVPPHLHLSPSVSLSYRRSISLLHLRYWSTMMLVTKPFLLCNLLQGIEHVETVKQPIFATLAKTCVSAAESSFEILESMVLHKVASSLVMADYLFALQALQVIVAACGLYHMDGHQARAKQCLRILLAISVSGYPKHLIPETLFQLQQCGLAEGVEETSNITLQPPEPLGYPQMVTEPLQRISLDQSTDQLAMTWLNELDMADIVIDNGFLDNLMDISSIFPFGSS